MLLTYYTTNDDYEKNTNFTPVTINLKNITINKEDTNTTINGHQISLKHITDFGEEGLMLN